MDTLRDMLKDALKRVFKPFNRREHLSKRKQPTSPGIFPRKRDGNHPGLFKRPRDSLGQGAVMANRNDSQAHRHKKNGSRLQEISVPKIPEDNKFVETGPSSSSKDTKTDDEGSEWQVMVSIQEVLRKLEHIESTVDQLKSEYMQGQQRFELSLDLLQKDVQRKSRLGGVTTEQHGHAQQQNGALVEKSKLLEEDNKELAQKNLELQAANDKYATKILSLQPVRYELLPGAAGEQFRTIVAAIDSWIGVQIYRAAGDEASEARFLQRMKENTTLTRPFRDAIQRDSELSNASRWPQCETEIISAFVSRFLYHEILKGPMYGIESPGSIFIKSSAESMAQHTKPRKDSSAIRLWVADSYHAMTAAPENQQHRAKALQHMTEKLAGFLYFLAPPKGERGFQKVLTEEIIEPTFRLQEGILCSSYHYYFSLQQASEVNKSVRACRSAKNLTDILDDLDLRNVAENHSKLVFQKLEPQPSLNLFRSHFQSICPLYPALMFAGVESNRGPEEAIMVERQKMLVSWMPRGSKNSLHGQNTSWIHRLVQMKT